MVESALVPLTPEPLSVDHFRGRFESLTHAGFQIVSMTLTGHRVTRHPADIARRADGSFHLALVQGAPVTLEQFGRSSVGEPGDLLLIDTDEPYTIDCPAGAASIGAVLGGEPLRRYLTSAGDPPLSVLKGRGAGRMAGTMLQDLYDDPRTMEDVADIAEDQLTALLLRAIPAGGDTAAAEAEILRRIRRFIADEIANPNLSAKLIATELGISRTTVFGTLAKAGFSLKDCVHRERLKRIHEDLRDPRLSGLRINEVARRWGYANPVSFSRAFRGAFGTTPTAVRVGCRH
nr:helix-turn-helix domain-containing protein [Chthonobacter rhizosphaerae]